MATLLCKLRIIRQSEFKITSGTLEAESHHVEGLTDRNLGDPMCVLRELYCLCSLERACSVLCVYKICLLIVCVCVHDVLPGV